MKNNKPFSNAKTVTLLSSHGFLVESVERILGGIKHRRDLYRMFDVLAMKPVEGVICIQCTTKAHLASHRQALWLTLRPEIHFRYATCQGPILTAMPFGISRPPLIILRSSENTTPTLSMKPIKLLAAAKYGSSAYWKTLGTLFGFLPRTSQWRSLSLVLFRG